MTDQGWWGRFWPWSCSGWQRVCRDQGTGSYGPCLGREVKIYELLIDVSMDGNWNKLESGNRHMQKEKMVGNHIAMKGLLIA